MKRINEMVLLRPWAMKQDTLVVMSQILERHLRGEKLSAEEIEAKLSDKRVDVPGYELIGGIARIPIYGVISKRASLFMNLSRSGTSVTDIQNDLKAALEDPNVKSILLDVDSPGGSVGGVAELADFIYSARGKKPINAYANGMMCSAAYWLGSAADKIYCSQSAEVGSIGVYMILQDYSVADHNLGIKTHVIKAGKYKAAGDESKPLTEDERAAFQEEINTYYELFVDAVARNRGISKEEVTIFADGRVWIGKKAEQMRLVDGVRTFEQMIAGAQIPSKSNANAAQKSADIENNTDIQTHKEGKTMELTIEKLKSDHKVLVDALLAEGKAAGVIEGREKAEAQAKAALDAAVKDAVKAETDRCAGIVAAMPLNARALAVNAIKEGQTTEAAKTSFLTAINSSAQSAGPSIETETDTTKAAQVKDDPTGAEHKKAAEAYQKEHKCSMTEALKATAKKRDAK